MKPIDHILLKLAELIQQTRFVELETEGLEIKPVPVDGGEWKERHKSVNAFLNTRGGILILGVKEEGTGPARRYALSGWKDHAEPNLKEFPRLFTDRKGMKQELNDCFPPMELRTLLGERIAIVYVDELAADPTDTRQQPLPSSAGPGKSGADQQAFFEHSGLPGLHRRPSAGDT